MSADPDPPTAGEAATGAPRLVVIALKGLRGVTMLGIGSLLFASAALLIYGVIRTARQIHTLLLDPASVTDRDVFLASIKLIDLILLATVMQVVGIGLYSLFIGGRLPVPAWLRTTHVDELKYKLAGIVAVMLGVLFLEQVFQWGSDRELWTLGLGIAAVILALGYYIRSQPGN
jgi:uncharacterized membrane protein YqhA